MEQTSELIFIDCCDVTGSMGQACIANLMTVKELIAAFGMVNKSYDGGKIAVVGDYDRETLDSHCGGVSICGYDNIDNIDRWLSNYMKPRGGGGVPEAYKTFFNVINKNYGRKNCDKIVFLYCDAPPHGINKCVLDSEGKLEEKYLKEHDMIQDWDMLCSELKKNKFKIFTFLTTNNSSLVNIYAKMGDVIVFHQNTAEKIIEAKLKVFYDNVGIQDSYFKDPRSDTNPEFIIKCFRNFLSSNGGIMSMITSPILGKFWRQKICGRFNYIDDGKYKKDCQELMNMLSNKAAKLTGDNKELMKKWIEESHNVKEEILDILSKITDKDTCDYIILPESDKGKVNIDDILELGRGGNFAVLGKLIQNLNRVSPSTISETNTKKEDISFIPLSSQLSNRDLFRLIANLLVDGLMFPVNVSYIAAILSINNKYIKDRAIEYLTENKGKWIDWSLDKDTGSPTSPMFWSINFFRVLRLQFCDQNSNEDVSLDYLTNDEKAFRDKFLDVANIMTIKNINLELTVPISIEKPRPDFTWKIPCKKGLNNDKPHSRCFTVTNGETESCYLCDYDVVIDEKYQDKTYWAQCRTCRCMYGITAIDDLNVEPKCHYCRELMPGQKVTCESCLLDFASPNKSHSVAMRICHNDTSDTVDVSSKNDTSGTVDMSDNNEKFKCPLCVKNPSSMKRQINVKFIDLLEENPGLYDLIPYDVKENYNSNIKLWQRVRSVVENNKKFTRTELAYNKFRIHNIDEIINQVKDSIVKYNHYETCNMCIEDVPVGRMTKACGNCQNRVCTTCVESWYGQVNLGEIINEANIKCPFCKCMPKFNIIKNLDVAVLKNIRSTKGNKGKICDWNKSYVYASCIKCLNVKSALERVCADLNPVEIKNWKCDECSTADIVAENKKCYNCGIMVEKTGGCNHITCRCGSHWCWTCEKGYPVGEIYNHMAKCGGIFPYDIGYESLDDDDY